MPPCGFGNRLLYYYNLRQEAVERNCKFLSIPWSGHEHFEGNLLGEPEYNEECEVLDFCLGDQFYKYNNSWNPDSILSPQYYYDAIEKIVDQVSSFILFTDDDSLESYANVIKLLDKYGIEFIIGENVSNRSRYINDFATMSECDWIISSPSTFCITSGFIGKSKNIIHSKEWIKNRIDNEDKFWKDLYDGGNQNYSLWEVI